VFIQRILPPVPQEPLHNGISITKQIERPLASILQIGSLRDSLLDGYQITVRIAIVIFAEKARRGEYLEDARLNYERRNAELRLA
jgi:hypothetical protein